MEPCSQHVLHAAVCSSAGCVRRSNQDAWSFAEGAGVFVVCDGMGGAAGGEVASQLAAEAFVEQLSAAGAEQRTVASVDEAVAAANRRVYARARAEAALHGMGTTLVGLAQRDAESAVLAHVGDSRCYRLRGGTLRQCTRDHSLVEEQLRLGLLNEEQAARSPLRHVLTRALGTQRVVTPDAQVLDCESGDVFLLCTDGLIRELADAEITALLGMEQPLQQRAEALVQAALAAGGRDNVTCLVIAADCRA